MEFRQWAAPASMSPRMAAIDFAGYSHKGVKVENSMKTPAMKQLTDPQVRSASAAHRLASAPRWDAPSSDPIKISSIAAPDFPSSPTPKKKTSFAERSG